MKFDLDGPTFERGLALYEEMMLEPRQVYLLPWLDTDCIFGGMMDKDNDNKRIYLAGPMRGLPNHNFPLFYQASGMLEMWGYTVINPAKMDIEDGRAEWNWNTNEIILDNSFTIENALARDFREILDCKAIVLLPGWEASEGAQKELEFALAIGLQAFVYTGADAPISIERDNPVEFE